MSDAAPAQRRKIHPLRDALLAGIITFVTSAVGLAIIYVRSRDAQLEAVRTEMLQLARTTAAQVDGDLHKTLVSPSQNGSPEHLRALAPLVRMHRAAHDVWYVYTGILREGRVYWILDSATQYRLPGNDAPPDPIMKEYTDADPGLRQAFREGKEFADPEPRLDDGHSYLSALAPIHDSQGAVVGMLGIDMVLDALDARMAVIHRALAIAFAAVLALSIVAGAMAHRVRTFAANIIYKLRRARAEAEKNAAAAESAARAKASFLAMMSHEIRTPMNGILGVADLLRTLGPTPEQKRLIDILTSSGGSLLRIINDILDFSKLEAERLDLHPRPFDLRELAEEFQHLIGTPARAKQVEFIAELDANLPEGVSGDRERISQVLLNLGTNAVKFTDAGEVRFAIRSHAARAGTARIEFRVSDTGIGMDAEAMTRLFTPFTQFAAAHHHRGGGTGLGLVIARKLVALMGGDIDVQSAPGKGSTFAFTIELPLATVHTAATSTRLRRLESFAVLVAEDNAVNQMLVGTMLKTLGHRATIVNNGREALEALAREDFDLVLMDCNMPEMDGFEATRRLRAGQSGARDTRIPVIAFTANAMEGDKEACIAAGMNDFVGKPVTMAALRAAMERVRPPIQPVLSAAG